MIAVGQDTWWLVAAKVLAVFVFLLLTVLVAILVERRVLARMQMRIGPNRVGPAGILQSLVDGVKLALKEGITPVRADAPVYLLAPIISVIPAFVAFAVIPLGGEVSVFGHHTALQLTDLPVAVLFVLAASSIGAYGIVLAGWASGSIYPLLGALRSTAQVISYEIAMALSFAAVFIYTGTMSTSGIVDAQHGTWYAFLLLPSFLIYVISMVGETNRAPFDLPEAEGELVGGFHTEYSSLKFAMFMLAEYVNMTTVSALATTLFLGGWQAPWPISLWDGANTGWWPLLWFIAKVWAFLFLFMWLRATLPRMRYDQFMALGWKVLIPDLTRMADDRRYRTGVGDRPIHVAPPDRHRRGLPGIGGHRRSETCCRQDEAVDRSGRTSIGDRVHQSLRWRLPGAAAARSAYARPTDHHSTRGDRCLGSSMP